MRIASGAGARGAAALARMARGAIAVLSLALVAPSPGSATVYTVQQGDTIEIAVAGLPELRSRTNVQPDGSISFPLLGALKAEGLTPGELRLQVQKQLAGKIYRLHNNDGREVLTVIEPGEVSAEIVGYRPIYVSGDVAHPGEQVFRPQMTVRQAIALAGGLGVGLQRSPSYSRDYPAVKSDLEIARLAVARASIRQIRFNALLAGQTELPSPDLSKSGLTNEQVAQLLQNEAHIFDETLASYKREQDFLAATVAQTADRITVVDKQLSQEEQGSQADSVELKRMITLLSKGQEINPRVTDARRALLLSSTRALQVNVELLDLKRQEAEARRNIQRLVDDHRIAWLKELEEAAAARAEAEIKVSALEAELVESSRSHLGDTLVGAIKTGLTVVRETGAHTNKLPANDDFELMPGDTIEVAISMSHRGPQRDGNQPGAANDLSMRAPDDAK